MAHLTEVTRPCRAFACTKVGTHELKNNRNSSLGVYCRRHGELELRRINKQEADEGDGR